MTLLDRNTEGGIKNDATIKKEIRASANNALTPTRSQRLDTKANASGEYA